MAKSRPDILFESTRPQTYRFTEQSVGINPKRMATYPVFTPLTPKHKALAPTINRQIRQCLQNKGLNLSEPEDQPSQGIKYEVVVMNESFFSIHLSLTTCGNRCHYATVSFNYDLQTGKQVSNCELLARLGITDQQFEKAVRQRWKKLAILEYDKKYPSFKEVRAYRIADDDDEETDEQNRYRSGPFDLILQEASLLPVVYQNQFYLRLGFNLSVFNRTAVGYTDLVVGHP
ncbi:hypothetical protein [Spirosoma fluviale]|nr:hypothetical protein [Spirosoma fluviale]